MQIDLRDGLLFTTIEITYKEKTKVINNIVVDTGAAQSLLSQECVDDLGLRVSKEDEIITSYGIGGKEHAFVKKIENVKIGKFNLENYYMDFTSFQYEDINGLLGLDLLMEAGFVIDLKSLEIYQK